jgi:3-isopropylmalate/(R)-2-methylmalate dehydratase large subunit
MSAVGCNLTEKLLAKAAGHASVAPGDLIVAKPAVVAFNDGSAKYLQWFEKNDLRLKDPSRVIFCFDHFFRANIRGGAGEHHPQVRAFARKQGLPPENVYDIGRHGLLHQVPAEEGWALPGTLYIGADSQSATMGGMGCFALSAFGEVHVIAAMGEVWLRVPEAIRINLTGQLKPGVLGKDVFLGLMHRLQNVVSGRVLEFTGPGVANLSIDLRMGIANGSAQIGALTMVFPTDRRLIDYVTPRAREPFDMLAADSDASYAASYDFDLSEFDFMIAGPSSIETIRPLAELEGTPVHAAYVGSCSSGRLEDLAVAAKVLEGRTIHPSVRMVVTPISSHVYKEAARLGYISTLLAANATVTIPGCGACYLGCQSPLLLDPGENCITGSVEVYDGRMGSKEARVYAATAGVIAASAIEGCIADPRRYGVA